MDLENGKEPLVLSREQIVDKLEKGAQKRLGISAKEMVDAFYASTLEDEGMVIDLLMLASLLCDDDEYYVTWNKTK